MPLELSGRQKRELRQALVDAFPSWNDLRKLTSDQLDMNLAVVTAQVNTIEDNAFDLITWASSRGELATLIVGARNQNPGNPKVEELAEALRLSSVTGIASDTLERVVSSNNTFLDVAKWRAQLTRSEWRVCRVDCDGDGIGTGFLVGEDLILTNYHVVHSILTNPAAASRWSCRFDYKVTEKGDVISAGQSVKLASAWQVDASPVAELDFALLKLAEPIGDSPVGKGDQAEPRGWIELSADPVDFASQRVIAILQHPEKLPMKLALGMNETLTVARNGTRVRYNVPTEPGSSGSPVFDGDWNLIALHHSAEPGDKPTYNEAIPTEKIAARPQVTAVVK